MVEYQYKGPVLHYDKVLANSWSSKTKATSKEKAFSNFKFQFKEYAKMLPTAGGIKLPGKITIVE